MTTTFASFVSQLEHTDAQDRAAHQQNLQDGRQLFQAAKEMAPPEVTRLLAAGVYLLEIAAGPEALLVERGEALAAARGLVDLVTLALRRAQERAPAPLAPEQPQAASEELDPEAAARTPRPIHEEMVLGRVLVELGHTTHAQIAQALEFQRGKGLPIGECLLLLGLTSPDRILDALRLQERMRGMGEDGPASIQEAWALMQLESTAGALPTKRESRPVSETPFPVGQDMFLGEVLLGAGMIDSESLEKAMHEHHFTGKNVGQALLEMGAIDRDELERGLALQATLRGVAGVKTR